MQKLWARSRVAGSAALADHSSNCACPDRTDAWRGGLLLASCREMGRPKTRADKKMIGFTVKLTKPQVAFIEDSRRALDVQFGADVIRSLVEALRTTFGLPAYQVDLLHRDMAAGQHTWSSYLQELLARRYEVLRDAEQSESGDGVRSTHKLQNSTRR